MADIANAAQAHASRRETMARDAAKHLSPLAAISADNWQRLADNSIEPNGYYLPDWMSAVNAFAQGRTDVSALAATAPTFDKASPAALIGLMPVISAWRAWKLPVPALVNSDPYGTLATPLLDRDMADQAAALLMQSARDAGAHAIIMRDTPLHGAAMTTFTRVLEQEGMRPRVLNSHARACLDATRDADELLREALGPKKLKELRRQRNRLAEHGDVIFTIATQPGEIERALETFLVLEASGWKAKRGTALVQNDGDAAFVRRAVVALAKRGQCEIVTLYAGETPVAAAIVLRHLDRAFYFKLGVDERFAKLSPGVQLTLDVTRHLCADPDIKTVDSTAIPGHPMIDPIWRGRLVIGDVLIPLYRNDPFVAAIRFAIFARNAIREPARRVYHFIRDLREKKS